MKEESRQQLFKTVSMTVLLFTGLALILFYGVQQQWGAVLLGFFAVLVACFCQRKGRRKN